MGQVLLSASFDDLRSHQMRLMQEASKLGKVHVLLWDDDMVRAVEGADPKFPQAERQYFVESVRYVDRVTVIRQENHLELPVEFAGQNASWIVDEAGDDEEKKTFCRDRNIGYQVIAEAQLQGYPVEQQERPDFASQARKKVVVTGCFDWLHSGHIRFFEEASQFGDLYVVVGHDANLRLLKGEGHPMHTEDQRRYMVSSIRFVRQALISSGDGWLDAEPEFAKIRPDIYLVNDDGARPEKEAFCSARGIEYQVLKRTPKQGLPKRQSTDLRGF